MIQYNGKKETPTPTDSIGILERLASQTAIAQWTGTPDMNMATVAALATQSAIPQETPMPKLDFGSTMISPRDAMMMAYIPAREFQMGSDYVNGDARPVHPVHLDSFWMDQTKVTNAMYDKCLKDGKCNPPAFTKSRTHDSYCGDSEFDNYPVIWVS